MATSLLQVRVEDSLKEDAARVFENLGIDTSTAIRMFLKRAVMDNGIPFRMTLPKESYSADRGFRAIREISEASEKNGTADMSLDEINAEIEAVRKERAAFRSPVSETRPGPSSPISAFSSNQQFSRRKQNHTSPITARIVLT